VNLPCSEVLTYFPEAKKAGRSWLARCPGPNHQRGDSRPSLSILPISDSSVFLHCFCGCRLPDIVRAAGLPRKDRAPMQQVKRRVVATYDYRDETGKLIFQVQRTDPKGFWQRRPHPMLAEHWIYGLNGGWYSPSEKNPKSWTYSNEQKPGGREFGDIEPMLYRLPELLASAEKKQPVILVEGEKDVETLRELGLVATTNSGGSGNWETPLGKYLSGRRVVVLPDMDEPGERWAAAVLGSLIIHQADEVAVLPHSRGYFEEAKDITEMFHLLCPEANREARRSVVIDLVRSLTKWIRGF
jgi:putative DNA primase/helicase